MPDGFLLGAIFTIILIALGLVAGAVVGRFLWPRTHSTHSNELDPVVTGLLQFTNRFSQDVSEYRSLIEAATARAEELHDTNSEENGSENSGTLLAQIMEANELLRKRLDEAEASLQCKSEELHSYRTEARTDALTDLPNRRAFDDELERRVAAFRRQGIPLGVLLVDVDRFKGVNDQHGHQVGDLVLKEVAKALRSVVRDCDLLARYGGEEFVVLLAGSTQAEFAAAAERMRRAVEQHEIRAAGKMLKITLSGGVAEATAGEDTAVLLRRADEALYAAKSGGRNCCYWHDGHRPTRISPLDEAGEFAVTSSLPNPSESFREVCAELRRKLQALTK